MNEFSLVSRIIGSLFYRTPRDPALAALHKAMADGVMVNSWPLEQQDLLVRLQATVNDVNNEEDYQHLFVGGSCAVSPYAEDYQGMSREQCALFLQNIGMAFGDVRADHFGLLVLAISWIEDNITDVEQQTVFQQRLFDDYLLPWCGTFLGKVEAHTTTPFYRTLAVLSREALQALYDELMESAGSE